MIIIYKLSGTADYSPSQVIETDFLFCVKRALSVLAKRALVRSLRDRESSARTSSKLCLRDVSGDQTK